MNGNDDLTKKISEEVMQNGEYGADKNLVKITPESFHTTNKELLYDLVTPKFDALDIILLPFPDHVINRTYIPELQLLFDDVEYFYQEQDIHTISLIEDIIKNYKNKITHEDYITLILKEAKLYTDHKESKKSIQVLQKLAAYEKYFNKDAKANYYLLMGSNLYSQAIQQNAAHSDTSYVGFLKAIAAFTSANLDTIISNEVYVTLNFNITLCHYQMKDFTKCNKILAEISILADTIPDKMLITYISYMQGAMYQKLGQYDQAIASYVKYLKYMPDDLQTRYIVRSLSEQPPE